MPEKNVVLTCENCDEKFERRRAEHRRNQKKGRHTFCDLSCAAFWLNKHGKRNLRGNLGNLRADNRRDEFSPFRQHLKMSRSRAKAKGREHSIDLEDLKQLWEDQEGCCIYTGWKLENPETTSGWENHKQNSRTASLDRIDNTKGYVKGNVHFVSYMANMAKGRFTEKDLLDFCKAVVDCGPLADRKRRRTANLF